MKLPKYVDIELNTSCNLHCEPCPYKEEHENPKFMSFELYKKIIDQIDWKCSIKLCQRGEPLLSPILEDAINYAHEKGLRTVINTNGILLNHEKIILLFASGLDELILSDYGIKQQIFNGRTFSYLNQMYGSPIWFTIKTEQPKKWKGIVDKIIKPIYYDYSNKEPDLTKLSSWSCEQLFERLIIEPDGIVRCCCGYIHLQKYIGLLTKNITLKQIWNNTILKRYRKLHLEGRSHELEMCKKCAYRKSIIRENVNIRL